MPACGAPSGRFSKLPDHHHAQKIATLLQRTRLRVSNEAALQGDIATTLAAAGIAAEREVMLSPADRPDFMCGYVAIEAKCRYAKRSIYRQLERYAAHDRVSAIVLVTGTAMGMPAQINGKPIYVVSIGRAFL